MKIQTRTWLSVLGLLLLGGSAGCHSFHDYCQAAADCEQGNDRDVEACIVEAEATEDDADLYGCSEWFNELRDCAESQSHCDANNNYTYQDRCHNEERRFDNCMSR